ncbi:hypothetical protein PQR65_03265 [Paraburkholderia nemoris]|uniref:hypothetical protein n=1 Tax=Paraburkholderia nemoris TaxID=2793076 RepID=UPI0038BDFA8F
MADEGTKKKGRRPLAERASTATERARRFDNALLAAGGRVLNRVRLSAEANAALQALSEGHHSEREAIEYALIVASKLS